MNRGCSLHIPYSHFGTCQKTSSIGKDKRKTSRVVFFVYRKIITIEIIDRDQYQRNETFLIRLNEPSLIKDEDEVERLGM
jgi:ribosomal protein S9